MPTTTNFRYDKKSPYPDIVWLPVRGADLVSGLTLYREPTGNKKDLDTRKLAQRTGQCQKGIHFGNACYDKISTWWSPVRRDSLNRRVPHRP